ncbi:hypothetical protein TWF718_011237 [Orbilia javanica]|uniref:Uncharacterized protein n=1 Tax=Orbilia javanica TaxID=47235 RepID=A0AAN8MH17_9PEZI
MSDMEGLLDPGDGEETMLTRIFEFELAGLLVLRDKLPQPRGACIACQEEEKGCEVSFILDGKQENMFKSFRTSGYLPDPLARIDDIENLLWTCPRCAELFDTPYPTIVILPKHLDFFILWEHRDYERRTQEATSGKVVSPRTVPEHDDYKGSYKLYILTDDPTTISEKLRTRIEDDDREIYTEASPTALILHAGRAMGTPMTYPNGYGLPADVKQTLLQLFILWERQPPGSEPDIATSGARSLWGIQGYPPSPSPAGRLIKGKGKGKGKRSRSLSSSAGSGDSVKSTTRTPKSKRVKMKELTRKDDRERRKAMAEGREYVSPASPDRWHISFVGSPGPLPKLRFGEKKTSARVGDRSEPGPSSGRIDEVEDGGLNYEREEVEGEREQEEEEEGEGMGEEGGEDYLGEDHEMYRQYSEDEDWNFGPRMSSSAIIERASKRASKAKTSRNSRD